MANKQVSEQLCIEAVQALTAAGGNQSEAARALGIPRQTFLTRMERARARGLLEDDLGAPPAEKPGFLHAPVPSPDLPLDQLLQQRRDRFKAIQRHEKAMKLRPVAITIPGPVGILHFGDPHCLTPDHEILTQRGWLTQDQLEISDLVAGVDDEGAFAWQSISQIIRKEVDEEIVTCDTETLSLGCTTKHRVPSRRAINGGYAPMTYQTADELVNSQHAIPMSAWAGQHVEADLSDDEIQLLGLNHQRRIPSIVHTFSNRQFQVFLDTVVAADGDRPSKNCARVYKAHDFLDQLQALCCRFGFKTKLTKSAITWGSLSIVAQNYGVVKPKYDIRRVHYKGLVWCVTVDHGNFFTRRNGRVHLTGNCDDDGCDIIALERHVEIVNKTKGMFAGNVGDTTNNWVGRLARLYANQATTASDAWRIAEWFVKSVPWLYMIAGNHDMWSGAGDPLRWMMSQPDIYTPSQARLELQFMNGTVVRINARHDFVGRSEWNPVHALMKAASRGFRDHLFIAGHTHQSGYGLLKDPDSGIVMHCLRVAGYKVIDHYAKERGFLDSHISPCVVTVIDPDADPAGMIQVFHDPELAADYLTYLRKRRGV